MVSLATDWNQKMGNAYQRLWVMAYTWAHTLLGTGTSIYIYISLISTYYISIAAIIEGIILMYLQTTTVR
jgi:hypothetical protein